MKNTIWGIIFCAVMPLYAQQEATVVIYPEQGKQIIHKEIYGQFAEHLGTCVYGGLWVGKDSSIPNINGYRKDVFNALKALKVPVLRWPGGCFADEYHWMDGIGPYDKRPHMVNNNWGGTIEDNSFGTHEFLNLCEMLECEPYISGNVGSGTVEEMANWVEYMTSEQGSPMAKLRKDNGREKPWKVKYFGVGNESWGCGGSMHPEYYADLYRRYSTYCRNYNDNRLFKIASGANAHGYGWTEVLMRDIGHLMDGLSLHYYTMREWGEKQGSATQFGKDDYYWTMRKCREIEDVLKGHIAIMEKYDPHKQISLIVDEWGTWWDEEPGTIRGHLYQQNTLRDAFVASLTLDIFHKYTDRIRMANIAQVVNVLQSMILTKGDKIVLTPTYYVFQMYNVHQDAIYLPLDLKCEQKIVCENHVLPMLSATASRDKSGIIHVSLSNLDLEEYQEVKLILDNVKAKSVSGCILTSNRIDDYNTFEQPKLVTPADFEGAKLAENGIEITLPAKSVVTLEIKL